MKIKLRKVIVITVSLIYILSMTVSAGTGKVKVTKPALKTVYSKVSGGTICQANYSVTCEKGSIIGNAMYYNKATGKYTTAHVVYVDKNKKAYATTAKIGGKSYLWKLKLWGTGKGNGELAAR